MSMKKKPVIPEQAAEDFIFNAKDEQIRKQQGNVSKNKNSDNNDSNNNDINISNNNNVSVDNDINNSENNNVSGNVSDNDSENVSVNRNNSGNVSVNIVINKQVRNEEPKRVSYYLKPSTIEKIAELARQADMGISQFLQNILDDALSKVEIK